MKSIYDTLVQNIKDTDKFTEFANRPRAHKLYKTCVIPNLEKFLHKKCIGVYWVEYNRVNKLQSNGIDGYFEFDDGSKIYFQEKTHLNTKLDSTTNWSPVKGDKAFVTEIVNHGGGVGWSRHLNNVSLLFIFYQDSTVVIGNHDLKPLSNISDYCMGIYNIWRKTKLFKRQRIEYRDIIYTLNVVSDKGVPTKAMIMDLPKSVIERDIKCSVKIYKV